MIEQQTCGALLKRMHDAMERDANNMLRSQQLTMAQVGTLLILRDVKNGQCSLKEFEQQFHVAQSTAAGIVVRLEQKGLVESYGDPTDKRVKIIRLTEAGRECCEKAKQSMAAAEERLLSGLTETERSIFFSLLRKITQSME